MINSDVQLFWANNENEEVVIIYDMQEEDRKNKYTCPVCGSDVKPVAIGGKRKDGKIAQVSSHFSHFDASKCNKETAIHWWFKNKILINGDSFIIKTDEDHEYKCKEVLIEQSYETEYGIYKPDITIVTECGKTVYFEMNYTNKKKVEDYLDKWLELGNPVVEVDLKMLMEASFNKDTYKFKALFYDGKCFNTKEDTNYYNLVNKYKNKLVIKDDCDIYKSDLEKLNWIWIDIKKYKNNEITIYELIELIQNVETVECRKILLDLLKKLKCNSIVDDYTNDLKDKIFEIAKSCSIKYKINGTIFDYSIYIPKLVYKIIFEGISIKIIDKIYYVKNYNEIQSHFDDKFNIESSKILLNNKYLDINEEYNYKKLCPNIDYKVHQVEVSAEGESIEKMYIKVKHLGGEFNINDNIHEIIRSHTFLTKEEAIVFNKITKEIKLELSDYLNNWEIRSTISAFNEYSIELRAKVHNEIITYCGNVYCHISLHNSKYGQNKGLNINYRNSEYTYTNDKNLKELKTIILNQFKWIMERKIPIGEYLFTKYLLPYNISFISKTINPNIEMKIKSSDTVLINIKNNKNESIELLLRNNTLYTDFFNIDLNKWRTLGKYLLDINEVINVEQLKEINKLVYILNKKYSSLKVSDYISKKYYDAKYSVINYIKEGTFIIELILCDHYGSPIGDGTIAKFIVDDILETGSLEKQINKTFSDAVRILIHPSQGEHHEN